MTRRSRRAERRSERYDSFAKIVAEMGDPEWRGIRRVLVLTTVAVLAAAFAVYLLVLPAPLEVLAAFVVSFIVGIVIDLVILKRLFRPRR